MSRLRMILPVAVAVIGGLAVSIASPHSVKAAAGQCLDTKEWSGWKASPDSKSIYLRVGVRGIWRLDLQQECPELHGIDARLVNDNKSGSPFACSPQDLQLTIVNPPGQRAPCIVQSMSQMSPEAAAALPKALQP